MQKKCLLDAKYITSSPFACSSLLVAPICSHFVCSFIASPFCPNWLWPLRSPFNLLRIQPVYVCVAPALLQIPHHYMVWRVCTLCILYDVPHMYNIQNNITQTSDNLQMPLRLTLLIAIHTHERCHIAYFNNEIAAQHRQPVTRIHSISAASKQSEPKAIFRVVQVHGSWIIWARTYRAACDTLRFSLSRDVCRAVVAACE